MQNTAKNAPGFPGRSIVRQVRTLLAARVAALGLALIAKQGDFDRVKNFAAAGTSGVEHLRVPVVFFERRRDGCATRIGVSSTLRLPPAKNRTTSRARTEDRDAAHAE